MARNDLLGKLYKNARNDVHNIIKQAILNVTILRTKLMLLKRSI